MEERNVPEIEISISFLLKVARKFWIVLLLATIIMAGVGAGYTAIFEHDRYVATASFWVNSTNGNVGQSEALGAAQMAANYSELATKDILLRSAVERGELSTRWNCSEETAVQTLRSMVSVGKSSDTSLIFNISVSSGNAEMTLDAITAVQYSMIEVVAKVNGDETGTEAYIDLVGEVLSLSDVGHIGKSYKRNVAVFAAAGLFLSYLVCFFIYTSKKQANEQTGEQTDEQIIPREENDR